jgi:catecholate siderophore receptor
MSALAKAPKSLRNPVSRESGSSQDQAKTVTLACVIAASSIGSAQAQGAPASALPAVTVDAPVARPRPPAPKPSTAQVRARTALRQVVRTRRFATPPVAAPASAGAVGTGLPTFARSPDGNPYGDPVAPYKADRLASNRFTEPLLNTPKTVTVLTKEILADKNATSFREIARSTAGVTLGTGEGGNAFGDRFFIRGFDARNDVFVDGIRDPSVSIRENFFTEQVEILRGPASSFAGRGTAGGAVNIVTKQAGFQDFYKTDGQIGSDNTKRVTVDVNQVISPAFAIRVNGLFQEANVAGRNYVFDDRAGAAVAMTLKPTDTLKFTANYFHTDLNGLPDFGVPFNILSRRPFTESIVPRNTYYGFVNRDFQRTQQDTGTLTAEWSPTEDITLSNRFRAAHSVLDYVGTLPEGPAIPASGNLFATTVNLNPQSRFQTADVTANVSDATFRFNTGPIRHTAVAGAEFSREVVQFDAYTGLQSELFGGSAATTGRLSGVNILFPPNLIPFSTRPRLNGNPTTIPVDTKAGYLIETANYEDLVILNGGVRFDDYSITSTNQGGSVQAHSGLLNYNVGLTVKPLPFWSVYGAYATSSNPVGAELDASGAAYGGLSPTATTNQIFGPERNTSTEFGTKAELFDRHLLATAALFRTTKDNAREVVGANIVAGAAYEVEGIDLGMAGKITDDWSVYAGYVLMDTKVTKSAVPAQVGVRLANIANRSFSLLTKYKLTPFLEIGGQAVSNSRISGGTLAANANVLPSYWRFDAFLEAKATENLTVKLYVANLFDRVYYDAFYRSAAPFVFIAPGRTVSLIASTKF